MAAIVVGLAGSGALAPVTAQAAVPSADLSVSVTHTPEPGTSPVDITFTITAANAGPDTAVAAVAALGFQYPLDLEVIPPGCRRSASYESIICNLGDIASGASASVNVVLQARGSGLYTLPVAVASDTADPDSADRATTDTVLVKPGPSQAVRYIRGIFPMIMNRTPDAATVNYWAAKWKAENNRYPRKLQKVPAGIINSNEYRRLRVRASYQRIFGRAPEATALTYWVNKAASGMAYETIDRRLLTSAEFTGNVSSVRQLVRNTYQAVFGRQPTAAEEQAALKSQTKQSYAAFVLSLQRSTEGYNIIIDQRYQATVGHPPSSLGRYGWQVALREGRTPESLWADLLVSSYVLQKYPYTEDDYSEEGYYDEIVVPASNVQAALAAG